MLVRFVGVDKTAECSFADAAKDSWAYDYIATATAAGWISGYSDNTFRPNQLITRAEAMTIINRVLNRGVNEESELLNFKSFPDNLPTDWFYYEVIEATNSHIYIGTRPSEDWIDIRLNQNPGCIFKITQKGCFPNGKHPFVFNYNI